MAVIKSGASTDELTIDPSKAARTTDYDATGRALAMQTKTTFFASSTFTPAATPTDLIAIFGSATKTVRVLSMKITTTNTAAGSQQFALVRRSSANSGGTQVLATMVPADSADSATATLVGHYTANPTVGGTVGTFNTKRVASPAAVPASFAGVMQDAGVELLDNVLGLGLHKSVVLSGIAQGLVINFAGAALVAGQTHAYQIVWTEE